MNLAPFILVWSTFNFNSLVVFCNGWNEPRALSRSCKCYVTELYFHLHTRFLNEMIVTRKRDKNESKAECLDWSLSYFSYLHCSFRNKTNIHTPSLICHSSFNSSIWISDFGAACWCSLWSLLWLLTVLLRLISDPLCTLTFCFQKAAASLLGHCGLYPLHDILFGSFSGN